MEDDYDFLRSSADVNLYADVLYEYNQIYLDFNSLIELNPVNDILQQENYVYNQNKNNGETEETFSVSPNNLDNYKYDYDNNYEFNYENSVNNGVIKCIEDVVKDITVNPEILNTNDTDIMKNEEIEKDYSFDNYNLNNTKDIDNLNDINNLNQFNIINDKDFITPEEVKNQFEYINELEKQNSFLMKNNQINFESISEGGVVNKVSNTTVTPKINLSFGDVHETADVRKVINDVSKMLNEAVHAAAEGIH